MMEYRIAEEASKDDKGKPCMVWVMREYAPGTMRDKMLLTSATSREAMNWCERQLNGSSAPTVGLPTGKHAVKKDDE